MTEPLTMLEEVGERDDRVCFFSRNFGDSRIVIVPKDKFTLSETDTTFVLTYKKV